LRQSSVSKCKKQNFQKIVKIVDWFGPALSRSILSKVDKEDLMPFVDICDKKIWCLLLTSVSSV
jgi:hypothetical protein